MGCEYRAEGAAAENMEVKENDICEYFDSCSLPRTIAYPRGKSIFTDAIHCVQYRNCMEGKYTAIVKCDRNESQTL